MPGTLLAAKEIGGDVLNDWCTKVSSSDSSITGARNLSIGRKRKSVICNVLVIGK